VKRKEWIYKNRDNDWAYAEGLSKDDNSRSKQGKEVTVEGMGWTPDLLKLADV